jgi:hypothetical protein
MTGGNDLLLRCVEYSYLKGQWPISRGDALEIDNKRVSRVLQKYIYIYIDTPSARRPRYIYGLIPRETIGLGKNP